MADDGGSTGRLDAALGGARRAAIGWLARHVEEFVPDERQLARGAKPLQELLLAVIVLLRRGEAALGDLPSVIGRLVGFTARPDIRDGTLRSSNDVVLRASLCVVLAATGNPAPALRERLQRAIDAGVHEHGERLSYQVMEESAFFEWCGLAHRLPSAADLLARSMLGRPLASLHLSERSTYDLTHLVMFGSAFGARPLDTVADLRSVLLDGLVRFQRVGHWDLVGELLLCWDVLGLPDHPVEAAAWRRLLARQDPDGSVLGIAPPDRVDDPSASASADEAFRGRYHTTLVLVLAISLRLDRQVGRTAPELADRRRPSLDRSPRRDAEWLVGLWESAAADRSAVATAGTLVGLALLSALDVSIRPILEDVARRAPDVVATDSSVTTVPGLLALAAYGVLQACGQEAAPFAPPSEVQATSWESRVLRARLGSGTPVSPLPLSVLVEVATRAVDHPGQVDLARLAQLAAACSSWGTAEPPALTAAENAAVDVLEALAWEAVRKSDLRAGAALLRSANALRPVAPSRERAFVEAVAARRATTGGYVSVEEQALWRLRSDGLTGGVDVDLDIRVPVALGVWWALAEVTTKFRLYRDGVGKELARA